MTGITSTPLCDKPRKNYFCGQDKYLRLIKHRLTERTFPIMEDDSYFLYVKSGRGQFTLNGVTFPVAPGCVCWIQCSHVLTIAPDGGEPLVLWSYVYDYQLTNYLLFRIPSHEKRGNVVYGAPILSTDSENMRKMASLFQDLEYIDSTTIHGSSLIKVSLLGQISLLFAIEAERSVSNFIGRSWPLGWRGSIYIASHSTEYIEAEDAAKELGCDVSSLNRELRKITGMNFEQLLSRCRCIMAASYFLYKNLPLDYIAVHSGFKSEVTFYRCFKKTMHMTPREYRENMIFDSNGVYRGLIMDETLVAVINYLFNNLSEQISMESMAKALFTSGSIIRSLLFNAFGTGYKEILSLFRIRYSESLLSSTDLPILDISVMVGFNSDRTYSRIFSSINGISPSEFRQLSRQRRGD